MSVRHDNTPQVGAVFGALTVIGQEMTKFGRWWRCRCSCGNEVIRQPSHLRKGLYVTCRECNPSFIKKIDLVGQRFGAFTVIAKVSGGRRGAIWQLRCDCGGDEQWVTTRLRSTKRPMCGECAAKGLAKPQSGAVRRRDELYQRWRSMIGRCELPTHTAYPYYGARGVTVCAEWHDYTTFEAWTRENGYERHLELDRIKDDLPYCPDNCRFIPKRANVEKMLAKHKAAGTGVYGGMNAAR